MTDFKVGDRVRGTYVLEGKLTDVDRGHHTVRTDDGRNVTVQSVVYQWEKVAPKLPTTPGSVIRHHWGSDLTRILDPHGHWRYPDGSLLPDGYVAQHPDKFEVIYDAGAK